MKDLNNILEECSINDIYLSNRGASILYRIPIYQRNYAWEREEIYALIKDVYDSLKKSVYYIGTLVSYKCDENVFEVIDGQQRLTTIYIVLKALGVEPIANRLTYSSRKVSAMTIEKMPKFGEEKDQGIVAGFKYAKEAIKDIVDEKKADLFKDFFLNKVHIIHYRVPKDVDLNHYFEVMNSRGEQLEKHEIVKAKLSEPLKKDDDAMQKFSRIWEACSDMNFYIQQKIPDMNVFGKTMEEFVIESFDEFPSSNVGTSSSLGMKTITEFLNLPIKKIDKDDELDKNDHFQPIIDFPNFLLIVLKITRLLKKDIPLSFSLDDKELIKEFENVSLDSEFVKNFAYNLLLAKYFLDNYVIHHTIGDDRAIENPWKLQCYYKSNKAAYPKDLYDGDNKAQQNEVIQLLSMFEVAFTPKQRKNYLFYCLYHLFKNRNLNNYVEFLRKLANKYFFDVYLDASKLNDKNQPKPNSFDETILNGDELNVEIENENRNFDTIYPVGACNIPLYVFNYTDYKIWKKYANELRGKELKKGAGERKLFFEKLGCTDFELEPFKNFYFSRTRKSLEHYYPQAKAGDNMPISTQDINRFGNFAMIGSDANSSGSNWNPIDKKNRYLDTKSNQVSVASLKFRIMLQICQDNYDAGIKNSDKKRSFGLEWNVDDMVQHQKKMLEIIMNS